jgi:hypothetical protein
LKPGGIRVQQRIAGVLVQVQAELHHWDVVRRRGTKPKGDEVRCPTEIGRWAAVRT